MPRPWDELEATYLIKHAGRDTVHDIATTLGRSRHDVRRECAIRGLNARAPRSSTIECPECHRQRTRLVRGKGKCRVCACRAMTARTETRILLEIAAAPARSRIRLEGRLDAYEPLSPPPARPRMPQLLGLTPRERVAALDRHAADIERWEWAIARREYDAARAKLHRLRVAMDKEARWRRR